MSFAGCQHEYKIDEEIGILCRICGFVLTEIRDVSPPFVSHFKPSKCKHFFFKIFFFTLLVLLPAF